MAGRWTNSRWRQRRRPWYLRRAPRVVQRLVIALAIIVGLAIAQQLTSFSAPSAEFAAPARAQESISLRVIDGDTYEIQSNGERIRQANIDTPETGGRERCDAERQAGERATSEARRLVNGAEHVTVRRTGREDQYGRTIGLVSVDGRDIGEILMESELARPWRGRREPCAAPMASCSGSDCRR